MKNTSKTIVFFGTDDFSLPSLQALHKSGNPLLVVSRPERPAGRGKQLRQPPVVEYAVTHGLDYRQPESWDELIAELKDMTPEWGLVVSFGRIIPQEVLDTFNKGILNIHPSLLPKYRGPSPITATILNGDKRTGVTLMKITDKMDAGPIYTQENIRLKGSETSPELRQKLSQVGGDMIEKNLPAILDGSMESAPQDDSRAVYCHMVKKHDGIIDWNLTAQQIEQQVRAYLEWPGARTTLAGKDVTITKSQIAHISGTPGEIKATRQELFINCKRDALQILKLKPAGKNEMEASAFLAGYRDKL